MDAAELMANAKKKIEQIDSISKKNGERRVYPTNFKKDLAILAKKYSVAELSQTLGIPSNSLYAMFKKASRASHPVSKIVKGKKYSNPMATPALKFMELPAPLLNQANAHEKISISVPGATQTKLVMKFATPSGTIIEIFE